MYGLEKKGAGPFEFDLEKEIHAKPQRGKEILHQSEKKIQELKAILRKGSSEKEFTDFGDLLHAYTCLVRVIKKITKEV